MTPETLMQRSQLSTELCMVCEARSSRVRSMAVRLRGALLWGALLLVCGCQSPNRLTRLFSQPKRDQDQSVLAILDQDQAGLPLSSKARSKSPSKSPAESITVLLDRAEDALSAYYQDSRPAHLTEAHRYYEQALAQESGHPESHHGLAIVCDLQKDYASAELHYRAALEGDPDNGKILGDLGYCYVLQNRFSEAESILLQATQLDPGHTPAFKNLAYVYAKQGNYNLADSTFRRVMNDQEVRQEMAQLLPHGRPDTAHEGERGKLPWQHKDGITTDEFKQRMDDAREQSQAEMRANHRALEGATAPALTIEQQQIRIAQLEQERDEALRLMEARSQQSSNTPLVLDAPRNPPGGAGPGMQIQPQFRPRSANGDDRQLASTPHPVNPPTAGAHRVQNGFYPDSAPSQNNRQGIQQAGSSNQPVGPSGQPINHALHLTHQGIDPRTGRPLNSQLQQTDGSLVPGSLESQQPMWNEPQAAPSAQAARFEEAKRRAAMAGLGGPEMMFPVATDRD